MVGLLLYGEYDDVYSDQFTDEEIAEKKKLDEHKNMKPTDLKSQ